MKKSPDINKKIPLIFPSFTQYCSHLLTQYTSIRKSRVYSYVKDIGSQKSSKLGRHLWTFSKHFTNPIHLSTSCFNTNRFKRQTAFRLIVATMMQTATHMVLMWNFVECRSGLKGAFSENVSKKQHGLTKSLLQNTFYTILYRGFTRMQKVHRDIPKHRFTIYRGDCKSFNGTEPLLLAQTWVYCLQQQQEFLQRLEPAALPSGHELLYTFPLHNFMKRHFSDIMLK